MEFQCGRRRLFREARWGLLLLAAASGFFVAGVVFAPQAPCPVLAPPGQCLPFGANLLGQPMLVVAAQAALHTGIDSLLAFFFAAALASLAVSATFLYRSPVVASLLQGLHAAVTSVPPLVVAIVMIRLLPPWRWTMVAVLCFLVWPRLFKLLVGPVFGQEGERYRWAAVVVGAGFWRRFCKYLGPILARTLKLVAPLELVELVVLHATLTFLGVGASDPRFSLGQAVAEGRAFLTSAPWIFWVPAMTLALLIVGLTSALRQGDQDVFFS